MSDENTTPEIPFDALPSATYIMTATHDHKRSGMVVHWVQPASLDPPLLCVVALKGHAVNPLIRDSRTFGICRIQQNDRLVLRAFSSFTPLDDQIDLLEEPIDPFDSLEVFTLGTGSPLLRRSIVAFDCEVVRRFDLEADYELFIGRIVGVHESDA